MAKKAMEVDTPLGKISARPGGNPHGDWTFGFRGEEVGHIGYQRSSEDGLIEVQLMVGPFIMDMNWRGEKWDKNHPKVEVKRHNNPGDNRGFTYSFRGKPLGHIEYDQALGEVCLFFMFGEVHIDARWEAGKGWFFAKDQVRAKKAAMKK